MIPGDPSPEEYLALEPERADEPVDERPPLRSTLVATAWAAGGALVLVGVLAAVALLVQSTRTETESVSLDDLGQLRIVARGVDLHLVPGTGASLDVTAQVTSGPLGTDFSVERRGDDVIVTASCLHVASPGCGAEVKLAVPEGLAVEVVGGSGDIDLAGLSGVVRVDAGSGDVTGRDLRLVELDAHTTSGDLDVDFATAPFGLKLRSDNGDIEAGVPAGEQTYAARITTRGDTSSDVPHDPAGQSFVTLESGTGDIDFSRD